MIALGQTLVSEDLFEKHFVCHLEKCLGACCVKGDQGAPLLPEEIDTIKEELPSLRPFLKEEYLKDIDRRGFAEKAPDGEWVTTCQETGECNFVIYERGIASCGIEKAWKAGATSFRKPVSCHLYPVRIKHYREFTAVNYDRWDICSPACQLGEELKVPVYRFVSEALIRRFGQDWFRELEAVAAAWQDEISE